MGKGDIMNEINSLVMTLVTGLFMLIGLIIITFTKNNEKVVNFSISMAFGVMVMLVILELIPESYELVSDSFNKPLNFVIIFLFILIGIIILKILDKFIPDHDIEEENEKEINENFLHIGIVSSIALVLHNLIEGMAIYSTMKTSFDMGILVTIGVGLHNIPMGMIVSSTFYKANKNLKKTVLFTSLIALSTFLGGLIMFALSSYITNLLLGILLCITLGMIIYIVVFELLSEILHNKNKKESFTGIAFGILIFILSSFFE